MPHRRVDWAAIAFWVVLAGISIGVILLIVLARKPRPV